MAHLQVVVALFCLFSLSWASSASNRSEAAKKFQITLDECKEEVGATTADVQDLLGRKPASTVAGKCFRSCLMKKYKVMDADGKFDKTAALEEVRKISNGDAGKMKLAQNLTNACSDIDVSSDHCEAAADYGHCFREQIKVLRLPQH